VRLRLEVVHSSVVDRRDMVVAARASMVVVDDRTLAVAAEDKCPKELDMHCCNPSRTYVLVDATNQFRWKEAQYIRNHPGVVCQRPISSSKTTSSMPVSRVNSYSLKVYANESTIATRSNTPPTIIHRTLLLFLSNLGYYQYHVYTG
jgi:hypothetical protein